MAKQKVIVIGAGVLGLFAATELLSCGQYDVTVLEKSHPGEGSSGRSVGMVETQYFARPTVEVRAYSRRAYERLICDVGLGFVHGGYLRLGRTPAELADFESSARIQRDFGIEDVAVLSREEISARWPQLVTDDLRGGLFGAWDGYVDGHEVCQKLVELVKHNGGSVHTGAEVTAAERVGSVWRITAGGEQYEADVVVNAAGAHGAVIGDLLGAPVPLLPQLHGAITVRFPALQGVTPFVMDYIPGSGVEGVYFRSEGEGHLIAGLHTEEVLAESVQPDVPLRSVSDEVLEKIVTLLMERLHDAEELELDRSWQGIYPMTPDHQPIVGAHPQAAGVVCALGGGGSGIQLAPAIGRLAADAIRGVPVPAFEIAEQWSAARIVQPGFGQGAE